MEEDSRKGAEKRKLLPVLLGLVEKCKASYGQGRVFNRVLGLVMAEIFAFGRHTITQLLCVLGLTTEDWSAWYRVFSEGRFDEEQTSAVMVREMLSSVEETVPFVVGVDGFHVPRCSETMPGTGWMRGLQTAKFKPGIQRGQRFVEASWLPPIVDGFSRAIPIRCLAAFTEKSVPCAEEPRTEVAAGLSILQWTRNQLDEAGRSEQLLLSLADGSYDTLAFWAGLPERTVAVVRSARNRALFELPAADAHGNRKYGAKAPAPAEWLKERKGFQRQIVIVRGQARTMSYRVEGPFVREGLPHIPLFLIVVGGGKRPPGARRQRYQPCFFLVSAVLVNDVWSLLLPIADLLAWLWQRWELEVAHRQMKTGLGLGEKQCWNATATIATVQWSLWIYALMLLTGYRVWGHDGGGKPPGLWRKAPKRWSFNTLWRALRKELWQHPDFRPTWSWSRANWLENEPFGDNLFNSVLGSARI